MCAKETEDGCKVKMTSNMPQWKKRMKIPDPQVLDAAKQYDDARQSLLQARCGLLPLLNTAAVAVELFLKSLSFETIHVPVDDPLGPPGLSIVYAAAPQRGKTHDLAPLFDIIPDDIRDRLEISFAKDPLSGGRMRLRDVLARYESLFEKSRYPFEQDAAILLQTLSIDHLMLLSSFLRGFVISLQATDRIWWT
jgi:hypothetical protein